MANERFPVLNKDGGEVLSLDAETKYTADMSNSQNNNCMVYIEFFSDKDGKIPASPSGGEMYCTYTPMGSVWLSPAGGATKQAKDVGVNGTYTPYRITGRIQRGRFSFLSVTGASYARVTFWRY